ncbi:MAG: NYN domain-containing protein [Candidatus ainarchaeum sp.]|nr:NYN domain-containing protein [Candidatus ainarchaeum sp.]
MKELLRIKKKTLLIVDWANVYGWKKTLHYEVCPQKLFNYLNRPNVIDKRFYFGEDEGQSYSINFIEEVKNIGFNVISKPVKYSPVLIGKQVHFKKMIIGLFSFLDNLKITNSEISNSLYELKEKVGKLPNIEGASLSPLDKKSLDEIFKLIEDLDITLKELGERTDILQEILQRPVYRRKCDFDVEITMDALNSSDDYETLLLFSGDGDYSALAKNLILKNKKVILVFADGHLGKEYNEMSKGIYFLDVRKIMHIVKK